MFAPASDPVRGVDSPTAESNCATDLLLGTDQTAPINGQVRILQRSSTPEHPTPAASSPEVTLPTPDTLASAAVTGAPAPTPVRDPARFASPPVTLRRQRPCSRTAAPRLTLGEFLAAATKPLSSVLPTPGRKQRQQPLNFTAPRRGRSATTTTPTTTCAKAAGRPTAERRAHVQLLRTLGFVGVDQAISAEAMKAYDGMFTTPIPIEILRAMAALIGRELPQDPSIAPITTVITGSEAEA